MAFSAANEAVTEGMNKIISEAKHVLSSGHDKDAAGENNGLVNRAGESRSPYVRGHMHNPVAWQLWGDEAIERAKKENKLLFVSIGYSACHWCHVMERESFENEEVASILNSDFIPIKIDREERPDIDRIYMNFVQATTGSGGWPLNVFVTPTLEPVFGGTYWPGPNSATRQLPLEDSVDFLSILKKLSSVWKEQEARCRQDSAQILKQLKDFAAEGTFGSKAGDGPDGLDIELLEEAYQHFSSSFDAQYSGFGSAPKFPTPAKLAFLLRLPRFPQPVIDIVGQTECARAEAMAVSTLRAMARGGIRDHIGHGFARYSVTADWSLPHFEKMLYDNAQLLHLYLDAFLVTSDSEFLGVVFDLAKYLTSSPIAAPQGGFFSSEDADSFYKKGDAEKREGAFYVWTRRELDTILGSPAAEVVSTFYGVSSHGNVSPENDAHDEFMNQNVLSIVSTPSALAQQFGISEPDVVSLIKESKAKLRAHRESERVRPNLDDKIVAGWNGIALGALARTGAVLKQIDNDISERCLEAAKKAARFLKQEMWDKDTGLVRVYREGRGDTGAFADDYAFVIEGLIDLYESTFEDEWLEWADTLQSTQLTLFQDSASTSGGFYATPADAPHTILRLKDGMDTAEPSTNGVSACNLLRLSSLLEDTRYHELAIGTLHAFEAEILQYPWLFASFMPAVVAGRLGTKSVIVVVKGKVDPGFTTTKEAGGVRDYLTAGSSSSASASEGLSSGLDGAGDRAAQDDEQITRAFHLSPRGGLDTIVKLVGESSSLSSWLRHRNPLLKDIKPRAEGTAARILICEKGTCKEEDLASDGITEMMARVRISIGGFGEGAGTGAPAAVAVGDEDKKVAEKEKEKEKGKGESEKEKQERKKKEREEEERLWGPKTPAADVETLEA